MGLEFVSVSLLIGCGVCVGFFLNRIMETFFGKRAHLSRRPWRSHMWADVGENLQICREAVIFLMKSHIIGRWIFQKAVVVLCFWGKSKH